MNSVRLLVAITLAVCLSGCGKTIKTLFPAAKPVPAEKAAYVGEWQEKTTYLLIAQDGSIKYKRSNNGISTSIEAPLTRFIGDNFEVNLGPITTTFAVSKPPYQDGNQWKMVVDHVELVKK